MEYEPIKKLLRDWIRKSAFLRTGLYRILGTLFLREWYVKREIRRLKVDKDDRLDILDAGAGFGQYSYFCARRFPNAHILGLELETDHVRDGNAFARAARIPNLQFKEANLLELDEENCYDLILCVDVMEHIENDQDLLNRFSTALKTSGRLIISTPSLYRKHAEDGDFVGEHYRDGYTQEDMCKKLESARLHIDKFVYGYGIWGDLSWRLGIRNTMKLAGHGILGKGAGLIYLTILSPLVLGLMALDYVCHNKRGTGMVVVASKP